MRQSPEGVSPPGTGLGTTRAEITTIQDLPFLRVRHAAGRAGNLAGRGEGGAFVNCHTAGFGKERDSSDSLTARRSVTSGLIEAVSAGATESRMFRILAPWGCLMGDKEEWDIVAARERRRVPLTGWKERRKWVSKTEKAEQAASCTKDCLLLSGLRKSGSCRKARLPLSRRDWDLLEESSKEMRGTRRSLQEKKSPGKRLSFPVLVGILQILHF